MPLRRLLELEPSSPLRYFIGAAIMMVGVVLPLGYMMFRNKRVPSSSASLSNHTIMNPSATQSRAKLEQYNKASVGYKEKYRKNCLRCEGGSSKLSYSGSFANGPCIILKKIFPHFPTALFSGKNTIIALIARGRHPHLLTILPSEQPTSGHLTFKARKIRIGAQRKDLSRNPPLKRSSHNSTLLQQIPTKTWQQTPLSSQEKKDTDGAGTVKRVEEKEHRDEQGGEACKKPPFHQPGEAENPNSFRFLLKQAENPDSFCFLLKQPENLDLLADNPSTENTDKIRDDKRRRRL
ncbi:hypothetical protein IEQ34_001504 [Dendrobium chrysotoxum]|uniref:Uncharacterized protein n=1 Tax=Dendrobium chrysotoxum TaxID=161865 RepID=A0AAV7HLU8_DENCH|nr:hypothetical protein IEQ34_001504 [Dendrobium chrysotoxum]